MESLPGRDDIQTIKCRWRLCLLRYCEWLGKTPDQLIAERNEDAKSGDPNVRHRHELMMKRFLRFLEEERDLSPNTRRNYYAAIRSFFKRNFVAPLNLCGGRSGKCHAWTPSDDNKNRIF